LGGRRISVQIAEKSVSFGDTSSANSYGYWLVSITKRYSIFDGLPSKPSAAQTPRPAKFLLSNCWQSRSRARYRSKKPTISLHCADTHGVITPNWACPQDLDMPVRLSLGALHFCSFRLLFLAVLDAGLELAARTCGGSWRR
jgi:hypothetical protein